MSSPEHWADSQLRNVGTVILHLLIDSSRPCPLPLRIGGRWATQVPEAYDVRGQTDQLLGPRCSPGALRVCGHEGTQIGKVTAAAHAVRSAAPCSWTSAPSTVPRSLLAALLAFALHAVVSVVLLATRWRAPPLRWVGSAPCCEPPTDRSPTAERTCYEPLASTHPDRQGIDGRVGPLGCWPLISRYQLRHLRDHRNQRREAQPSVRARRGPRVASPRRVTLQHDWEREAST